MYVLYMYCTEYITKAVTQKAIIYQEFLNMNRPCGLDIVVDCNFVLTLTKPVIRFFSTTVLLTKLL